MHGVGGRTIAEAQQNISMVEARHWAGYIKRHGSLNVAEKVEQSAALICSTAAQLMGNKRSKIEDFIPNRESEDKLTLATPQDFLRVLQGARKG